MTHLHCRYAFVFAALFLLAATFLGTQQQGEDLLIQKRYRDAAVALEQALGTAKPAEQDRLLVLLAEAQWLAGDRDAARATLVRFEREQPGSALLPQSRYLLAKVEEGSANLQRAAEIHRGEAERLTGFLRKEEVAKVYLELADKAEKKEPKDHARVAQYCDLALDLGLRPELARSIRLRGASALRAAGNPKEAAQRLWPLVKELDADQGKRKAMLLLGRSLREAGDPLRARTVLRDLLALGKDAAEAGDAAFEVALTFGVPEVAPEQVDRAVQALRDLRAGYPQHEKARIASFLVARCYATVGRGDDALHSIDEFLAQDGVSALPEAALARALRGDVLSAQQKHESALLAWREYLAQHPAHADWERVQRAIVDAEWSIAIQPPMDDALAYATATERLLAFGRAYPLEGRNAEGMCAIAAMLEKQAKYDEAKVEYQRCVSKHPGRDWSSRAQHAIGRLLETKLDDYDSAIVAYRAVTWGPMQGDAQLRIATLSQKSLRVHTDRVFRSDEKASFQIVSRNIETLRVRVYKLQLEDWFRATRQAGQVHELDIEVIAPDITFDSVVPAYVRCRETDRAVEIPAALPGAYVVKVDDKELEATTLVIVSDLALVTKASRLEFLVFAQNTKEQRVEAGVRVALGDGNGVVAEGVTGADGIWRFRGEQLKNRDDLRVFAVATGGSAATTLDMSGMGFSPGLQPQGFLATDRPLYQPGQRVHCKGVVREVEGGIYRLPAKDTYVAQVFAPSGRLVQQRDVVFSEFGTFDFAFDLGEQAELGEWRAQTSRKSAPFVAHSTSFEVGRYERPRLQLAFELREPVVLRGEPIRGVLRATWFYGEPFAMREVVCRLALPDGAVVERRGTTNAAGELPFETPTTEFQEEAMAQLTAEAPGENATASVVVPVVTTELALGVSVPRPVYLAGEPFEATLRIEDRSGKPLSRKAEIVLYQLRKDSKTGVVVEAEVARKEVQSGSDGVALATFASDRGGDTRLRAVCKDRFGGVVTAHAQFTISGADDEQKLRLLADRESWSVGETARVRVVNRAGRRLALLTWQGDGILQCEPRMIEDGESAIDLPMQPEHAPNFAFAVAIVAGKDLHTAERPFLVRRELRVEVEAPKVKRPQEEMEVVVRVRDPQGRPVRAEVAIAVVDESLLAVEAGDGAAISERFWGRARQTSFRTASSCTWAYEGHGQRVNAALLHEEVRLRAANEAGGEPAAGFVVHDARNDQAAGADQLALGETDRGGTQSLDSSGRAQITAGRGLRDSLGRQFAAQSLGQRRALGQVQADAMPQSATKAGNYRYLSLGVETMAGVGIDFMGQALGGVPRVDFRETAAWIPSLVTDENGVARTVIRMPDTTTCWRILARSVTADTWVGEGKSGTKTQQDLQVELVGPIALTEGDEASYAVRAHNLSDESIEGELELSLRVGETSRVERSPTSLGKSQESESAFAFTATEPGIVRMTAKGTFGDRIDAMVRDVLVQPFGAERMSAWSGRTRDRAMRELSLPDGADYASLRMVVELGGDLGRDLVRAALGEGFVLRNCVQSLPTNLGAASHGLAALLALDYLEATNGALPGDRDRLLAVASSTLQSLTRQQQDGGAFSWTGRRAIDWRSTGQALRFFALAARRGMVEAVDPQNRAAEALLGWLRTPDNEARADMLWALASVDRARFEALNALHRARGSLRPDGLARLALAWQAQSRPELAAEALTTLRSALPASSLGQQGPETVALCARALLASDPRDALGEKALLAVREARMGAAWATPEATAAAIAAIAFAERSSAGAPRATSVTVVVNGHDLATGQQTPQAVAGAFVVPAAWLKPKENVVQLKVEGGGEAFFAVTLAGFAKGFPDAQGDGAQASVLRRYRASPMRRDGKNVPSGFSVVQGKNIPGFTNEVTQLGVGETLRVETTYALRQGSERMRGTPIVVEEPLPAGCSVPKDSIQGGYDHVEVVGDRIVFYFPEGSEHGSVSYELQARHVGVFRALPTIVYAALRPEVRAMGKPQSLRVHPRGAGERDAYKLTPDELYALGKADFDAATAESRVESERAAAVASAQERLALLVADWNRADYRLRDDVAADCARMLLYLGIERGDGKQVVRFFEELKDRQPDLVIPFDKILGVGRAYFDLGEFESALLVFRGTEEASFLKDAAVATTLQELQEHKASIAFLERLLLAYPDLPTMRTSRYGIAQQLAGTAAERDPLQPIDDRIGSVADLRRRAVAQMREFLVLYPDDPLADEVSFAWATTLLEGKDLEGALAVATAALARYPDSPFEDEQLYTVGYAQFALGRHDAAFEALQKVATGTFRQRGGGRVESESKWHAVYLQGQIWHARGEPEKALIAYDQVKDRFGDAVEAAEYFRQKVLSLDEVTTFAVGGATEVAITFRNVERAQLQVFKVDLVRLYLMQKSLEDIRGIKLHGIAPMRSLDVELGKGRDYANQSKKVDLLLTAPGAYLCVLRSGDRVATGMALVTDIRIEAQEQFDNGHVRVNVRRGDGYVAGAHVKIVGSNDGLLQASETDLRGVASGDGLVGRATVLASLGDHYAFYRGAGEHQAALVANLPQAQQQMEQVRDESRKAGKEFQALDNNFNANVQNRGSQVDWLKKNVMNKQQKGVEVYRTK